MRALSRSDGRSVLFVTVVTLVPLVILPGVLFHFDVTPKVVVLLLGAAAAAALARATPPGRWLGVALALQALSLVVSTALSTDPALSLAGTNWRRFGLLVQLGLLLLVFLFPQGLVVGLLRAIALSGSLAALYGIVQYFGWDPVLPSDSYHVGEGEWTIVRPPATLGHAGYFAVYLVHVAFAGLTLAMSERDSRWRRTGAAAAALAAAAIVLSGARAGMLGLTVGVAALAAQRRPHVSMRRMVLGAAAFAVLAVFYFSPAGLPLRARARWFREDPLGGGRLQLWSDTLRMVAARPLAGVGPETFGSEFPRFQSEALARQYPERYYESPHNIFLDALVSQGPLGLAALVMLCALALGRGARAGPWGQVMAAGLAGAVVSNQFVVFTVPTALMFYVTVASLCALHKPPSLAPPRVALRLAALPLAAAAVSFAWTDYWLARTRDAFERGHIREGIELYARARQLTLPGVDTDLWYSRALLAAASSAWQPALEAARRSSEKSEQRPNAYYNLAAFYAMQNDFARTEESLRASIARAPQWYKPRWMLAQVLREAGRLAEAEAEARRAAHLNAGKNPEVTQTWREIQAKLKEM